jgi:potassium-transporting ATPase ATP-binding subunit
MWNHFENRLKNYYKTMSFFSGIDARVIVDSFTKLNPYYLAKYNPVMFTVELGFFLILFVAIFPTVSSEFIGQSKIFYYETSIILILTVWFATFSESLSEAQARARVDSLRSLEKEVLAHKIANGNGKLVDVKSTILKPGDEVRVYAGEIIPRDGLVNEGKAFVDESMMTGESNPVFKEKGDNVIGGTKVASDNIVVEITAEAGRSFLDQMIGLIQT